MLGGLVLSLECAKVTASPPPNSEVASTINAANLISAHAQIESGTARGKIALEGF